MKNIAGRVFRHTEPVRLVRAGQQKALGRGIIARWKGETGDGLGTEPHVLGQLQSPLYVFTGELDQAQPGDVLVQGGSCYQVLSAGLVTLGDTVVCLRAVLEKKGDQDDSL